MSLPTSMIILLIASLALSTHTAKSPGPESLPFLTRLVTDFSIDKIVEHYEHEMEFLFGYKIRSVNSLLTLLQELSRFRPEDITGRLSLSDSQTAQTELLHFLSMTRGTTEDPTASFGQLLKKFFAKAAYVAELKTFDAESLITPTEITAALEDYMVDRKFEFAKPELKASYLDSLIAYRNKFITDHASRYSQFLAFRSDPIAAIKALLIPLATHYANVECLSDGLCGHKVAQLTEFVSQEYGFEVVRTVAMAVIENGQHSSTANKAVTKAMVGALLEVFLRATTNADYNIGKSVFLRYFSPTAFGTKATPEYQEFIRTKYSRERLKFSIADAKSGYPELLRIYTLDVLDTSLSVAEDFLRPADLQFIFKNFHYFSSDMDSHLIPYIQGVKRLFTENGKYLSQFYELFNGLYDAMLLSGPYLVGKFWPQDWSRPGLLFDDFLNRLLTWEKSKIWSWWEWQPNSDHFAVNIKTNYFFYKLVNLRTNLDTLKEAGVSIGVFEPRDDFLIHQFTLVPKYRRLVFSVRGFKQGAKGFNYHGFAGRTLTSKVLTDYAKYELEHDKAKKLVDERAVQK